VDRVDLGAPAGEVIEQHRGPGVRDLAPNAFTWATGSVRSSAIPFARAT
jgi:hypothetical protein